MRKYGLLTDDVDERPRAANGTPNRSSLGVPVTLEAFRDEARLAHDALVVYEALRSRRYPVLRERITRERDSPPGGPPGRFANSYVRLGDHDFDAGTHPGADGELADEDVLTVAGGGLEHLLSHRLEGRMKLRFGVDLASKRPLSYGGRPVPVWVPADLQGAAWHQFLQLVADSAT